MDPEISNVVSIILLFSLARSLNAAEIQFHLPVRITAETATYESPETGDFQLVINGAARDILAVKRKRKSLVLKPDLGREFILSFRLSKYGPEAWPGRLF